MTEFWWTCPWCLPRLARLACRHTADEAAADRDAHMTAEHPFVVATPVQLAQISHYTFMEVHT